MGHERLLAVGIFLCAFITGCDAAAGPSSDSPHEVAPARIKPHQACSLDSSQGPPLRMALFVDNDRILSSNASGTIQLWNCEDGRELKKYAENSGRINAIVSRPNGKAVLTSGPHDLTVLWDLGSGEVIHKFQGTWPDTAPMGAAVSPDGKLLATGDYSDDGGFFIHIWDLNTAKELNRLRYPSIEELDVVAFSPDSRDVLAALPYHIEPLFEGRWALWNAETGRVLQSFPCGRAEVGQAAFLGDGRLLGSAQNGIYTFDIASGKMLDHRVQTAGVLAVCQPTLLAATGGARNNTALWNLRTMSRIAEFGSDWNFLPGAWVQYLSFSPDGTRLAVTGYDGRVRIWELASRKK
jgi:WD40 repeat protein